MSSAPCGRRFGEELLSGYLDGALTQRERQRVSLHLEGCPDCRRELMRGMPAWERVAIAGGIAGFALLLLSVLLDRLHDLRFDRYRRVQK